MLGYALHIVGAALFVFGVYYNIMHLKIPLEVMPATFGGKLKYLTFWDALIQTMYFIFCVIIDIIGLERSRTKSKYSSVICQLRDYIFTSIGFPCALYVSSTFWVLFTINRELVMPKKLDPYYPLWLNHIMHTCVSLWVLAEMILCDHIYPKELWKGLLGMIIFQIIYIIWIHIVYLKSGVWVYNILGVLCLPLRILFLAASVVIGCLFWFLGYRLHIIVWRNRRQTSASETGL